MWRLVSIIFMLSEAVHSEIINQDGRFLASPVEIISSDGGSTRVVDDDSSILIQYNLADIPLETSLNSMIRYNGTAVGTGLNPSIAVWAANEKGEKTERLTEVTIKTNATGTFLFPISDYIYRHLKDRKISLRLEMCTVPGFSQSVEFSGTPLLAIVKKQTPDYALQDLLLPVWKDRRMVNETILPTSYNGEVAKANLAFVPSEIISVKNYALDKVYENDRDYVLDGRTLRLTAGGGIPFFRYDELYHNNPLAQPGVMKTLAGGYLTFSESSFFNDKQLAVTYAHDEAWSGPVPESAEKYLPRTFQALRQGTPLKLVVFGDSISSGSNASGKSVRAPWMPRWADLVVAQLRQTYHSEIEYINPSLGGMTSRWGKETIHGLVSFEKPDLVILGFGMNDGGGFGVAEFVNNTTAMMESVRTQNPNAEFILIMSMQPNARWRDLTLMSAYKDALKKMEGPSVAVADIWSIHSYLLEHKTYWDMTGNHVNHPNDFLVRIYAQVLLTLLGAE